MEDHKLLLQPNLAADKNHFFAIILSSFNLPNSPKNCAKSIFKINGNESSTVYVSLENLFSILPNGDISKNVTFAYNRINNYSIIIK